MFPLTWDHQPFFLTYFSLLDRISVSPMPCPALYVEVGDFLVSQFPNWIWDESHQHRIHIRFWTLGLWADAAGLLEGNQRDLCEKDMHFAGPGLNISSQTHLEM